jgi:hypothetical protein
MGSPVPSPSPRRAWLRAPVDPPLIAAALLVEGILQTHDDVVSIRADRLVPLPRRGDHVPSRDFG